MNKREHIPRLAVLAAVCLIMAAVYMGRLLYLQVSGQDYYSMSQRTVYHTRTETIQAERGEIFDRNGTPLVTNDESRVVRLDYQTMPRDNESINTMLLDLDAVANRLGEQDKVIPPKDSLIVEASAAGITFSCPEGFLDTTRGRRYTRLVGELNVEDGATTEEECRAIMFYYGILSAVRDPETNEVSYYYDYPYPVAASLFLRRLDMTLSEFSALEPYTIAEDVSMAFVTGIGELYSRGFEMRTETTRVYHYPGYLSHILGWIGRIPSGRADYFKELGYANDSLVGRDGCEAAFEEYLHGADGLMTITEDSYGTVVRTEITKEPKAGCDLYLTIDINMQVITENALAENVLRIREGPHVRPLSGEDAYIGAMTVLDPKDNQIIAIASYPTYNLATVQEDYAYLNEDEHAPMFNRALLGGYAPGSTFKIGVATAALMEGTITRDTVIDAQGQYMYYADTGYTPRCWLFLLYGEVHGKIKVVEAIQESCNYFFFDVGRQLTIEKMNEYCGYWGLGQPTGIELPEFTGILAGPAYRNAKGLNPWGPGDTLQAAIGQSDNMFTPLQIGCYISTILNRGTRWAAHIVKEIRDYKTGEPVFLQTPQIMSQIDIPEDVLDTVKEGMKGVMDLGSAATVFKDYPIPIGGKTGTAQVSPYKSDNGIITAFAPFDNPEILVTTVIEQASGGTEAGYSIRDVLDYYFDVDGVRAAQAAAAAEAAEQERIRAEEEAARAQAIRDAEAAWLAENGGGEEASESEDYTDAGDAGSEAYDAGDYGYEAPDSDDSVPEEENGGTASGGDVPFDTTPVVGSDSYADDGSQWTIDLPGTTDDTAADTWNQDASAPEPESEQSSGDQASGTPEEEYVDDGSQWLIDLP